MRTNKLIHDPLCPHCASTFRMISSATEHQTKPVIPVGLGLNRACPLLFRANRTHYGSGRRFRLVYGVRQNRAVRSIRLDRGMPESSGGACLKGSPSGYSCRRKSSTIRNHREPREFGHFALNNCGMLASHVKSYESRSGRFLDR